jgi:hypothetical protein
LGTETYPTLATCLLDNFQQADATQKIIFNLVKIISELTGDTLPSRVKHHLWSGGH